MALLEVPSPAVPSLTTFVLCWTAKSLQAPREGGGGGEHLGHATRNSGCLHDSLGGTEQAQLGTLVKSSSVSTWMSVLPSLKCPFLGD